MRTPTIIRKVFETSFSFHLKYHTAAKVQKTFASTDKNSILGGELSTRQ